MTDTPYEHIDRPEETGQPSPVEPGPVDSEPGADVVPLRPGRDGGRGRFDAPDRSGGPVPGTGAVPISDRPAEYTADRPPVGPADDAPDGPKDTDRDGPVLEGDVVRVDSAGGVRPDWLAVLPDRGRDRRPIVPAWLRSRREAAQTLRWVGEHAGYVIVYQVSRSPKYAARLTFRAPRGLVRLAAGTVRWTFDLEGLPVRLAMVQRADPESYLRLSRQRDARVRLRVWVSGVGAVVTVAAGWWLWALVSDPAASWTQTAAVYGIAAVAVGVLGVVGRPADRPLIDRAVTPTRVEKLTSDIVIRALTTLGIAGITQAMTKTPKDAIRFVAPITRDGPGWRADVDLPYGVTVGDVLDKRERLSGALRRPLGCIWPEGDSSVHEGRLVLWVGDRDLSKTVVKSPLLKAASHDVFTGIPFGNDPRGRLVTVPLIQHNVLIGSLPGQGKTSSVRELAAGVALDVTAEGWFHELKGTGDLDPYEKVCHRYVSGIEDQAIGYAATSLALLRTEVMRRSAALKALPPDLCPDKRVTRQIADKRSLGLHPLVCIIDECQNLFAHPTYGAKAGQDAEFIIKLGRALGVVLILATQRPDRDSLPTGISANVSIRFCLRVAGQIENDMILGTSAYKNGIRATVFIPEKDAGTGYLVGATPMPKVVKSAYLNNPETQLIADRAHQARKHAGTLTGHATGDTPQTTTPAHDLLADIAAVVSEAKLWNETVVDRLAELRPEVYGPWAGLEPAAKTAQLTTALKPHGIRTGQVWGTTESGKGANRIGITRTDITTAITERDGKRGSGSVS